jgi:dCMP deaminase
MTANSDMDRHFLGLAYEYAKKHSPDPRTQNGAIIVDSHNFEIISYGANRLPNGVNNLPERLHREHKRDYLEHAERDAIFSALRQGKNTMGATMYVPWFACSDCAKAIIGAGINCVVGHHAPCATANTWSASIDIGLVLLNEAKISYRYYDGQIGVKDVRFGGETIER